VKIFNGKLYLNELIRILSQVRIIKHPKDIHKLFKKGTLHKNKNGEIVGWFIQGEIKFWSNDYLDVNESAQKYSYNNHITLENFSYHFNPENENLNYFRIDKMGENLHANTCDNYNLKKHLLPEELKLEIEQFNLIISIHISMTYISNPDKYPLLDEFSEMYNNIIVVREENINGKFRSRK
jgi:hypothetical protein